MINKNIFYTPPWYVQIELNAERDWLRIFGVYKNEMYLTTPYFKPAMDYFTVGANATFKNVSFKIEHLCVHPVLSSGDYSKMFGGHNKFEISISSKP